MENGQMICTQQGGRAEVSMEVKGAGRGLYRGVVLGQNGRMDLGTLLPEGGCLRLRRNLPVEKLRRQGCWPITGARAELSYAFESGSLPAGWTRLERPEDVFPQDPLLCQAARESEGGMLRRPEDGGFLLAYPWDPRRPFPLEPAFCFARVRTMEGRQYTVFRFQENGSPAIFERG